MNVYLIMDVWFHLGNVDLDVSAIDGLGELEVLAEALLLEVANRELVRERQEVVDAVPIQKTC